MVAQPNNNTTGGANLVKKSNLKFVLKNNRKSEPFAATNTLKKVTIINNFSADDEVGFLRHLCLLERFLHVWLDYAQGNVPIECLDVNKGEEKWIHCPLSFHEPLPFTPPPDVYNLYLFLVCPRISFSAAAVAKSREPELLFVEPFQCLLLFIVRSTH